MMIRSSFMPAAALAVLMVLTGQGVGTAQAQEQTHWLVGRWVGDVEGMRGSKYGTTRIMKVESVQPDGALQAGWGVNDPKIGNATARLAGDRIELVTGENTRLELSRADNSSLEGTFTPTNGRSYPIRMKKQQ